MGNTIHCKVAVNVCILYKYSLHLFLIEKKKKKKSFFFPFGKIKIFLTNTMRVKQLTEDCVKGILEYVSDDKITLYSCLRASRAFCKSVVPILWRNPWINSLIYYDD